MNTKLTSIVKILLDQIRGKTWHVKEYQRTSIIEKYMSMILVSHFSYREIRVLKKNEIILTQGSISNNDIVHRDLELSEVLHTILRDSSAVETLRPIFNQLLLNLISELTQLRIAQGRIEDAGFLYENHIEKRVFPELQNKANVQGENFVLSLKDAVKICFPLQELAAHFYNKEDKSNKDYESALLYYRKELQVFKRAATHPSITSTIDGLSSKIETIEHEYQNHKEEVQKKYDERRIKQELPFDSLTKTATIVPPAIDDEPVIGPSSIHDAPVFSIMPAHSSGKVEIEIPKIKENENKTVRKSNNQIRA